MFTRTDFWIGLAVGVVAGAFGYKYMQNRVQQQPVRYDCCTASC